MSELQTTVKKFYSAKLQKDISLEVYPAQHNGKMIITATSLKYVFESVKDLLGITDSVSSDVRINNAGNITYVSVEWTLKDSNGYCSTFIGEATPGSLNNVISRQHPKTMAYNRALSAGIRAYLQLPMDTYTDDEITPAPVNAAMQIEKSSNTSNITVQPVKQKKNTTFIRNLTSTPPIKKAGAEKKANEKTGNTTESDEKSSQTVIQDKKETQNNISTPITSAQVTYTGETDIFGNPIDESLPAQENSESELPFVDKTADNTAKKNDNKTKVNQIGSDVDPDNFEADDDSVVHTGMFSGRTVAELFDINTVTSKGFIQLCVQERIKDDDPCKQKILEYIAKKAKDSGWQVNE